MGTASVIRGGTGKGPSAGTDPSLYINSDYPGQWVIRIAPPPIDAPIGTVYASGWALVTEGAAGASLQRRIPWAALGTAIQCRGANISVLLELETSFNPTRVFVTASQGAITERWTGIGNVIVGGGGNTVITLPQFAKRFRMDNQDKGGGPITPITLTFQDSTGAPISDVWLGAAGSPIEAGIPANAVFCKVGNGDAVTLTVAASVLIDE